MFDNKLILLTVMAFTYLFAKVLVSISAVIHSITFCCVNCFAVNYRNAHWEHTRMSLGLLSLYAFHALLKNSLTVLYTLASEVILSLYIFVVIVKMPLNSFEVSNLPKYFALDLYKFIFSPFLVMSDFSHFISVLLFHFFGHYKL
jgi:hypothetical protein